eukprot:gb/GEZN01016408.1/.p1 GENE.gb/GEZN01016408.1/~~gb/GEZN01016408.1/.p1  ORF type:complete len:260 (-),score=11.26 gb/GEZN01016408.1/:22-801(-)
MNPNLPVALRSRDKEPQPWNEELFDCCADLRICCVGCCCPCYLYGHNANLMGDEFFTNCAYYLVLQLCCLCCLVQKPRRSELRKRYDLEEICCGDCCNVLVCPYCSLCQEARELHIRGVISVGPSKSTMMDSSLADPMFDNVDGFPIDGFEVDDGLCTTCQGIGNVQHGGGENSKYPVLTDVNEWCPDCQGTGHITDDTNLTTRSFQLVSQQVSPRFGSFPPPRRSQQEQQTPSFSSSVPSSSTRQNASTAYKRLDSPT